MSDGCIRMRFSILSVFDIIRQKSGIADIIRIPIKFIYITEYKLQMMLILILLVNNYLHHFNYKKLYI
jgi:hypothetical protein